MYAFIETFLTVWPPVLVSDFLRYSVAAGGLALVLHVFRRALAHRRIQSRIATVSDRRREIGYSLMTVVVFSLFGFLVYLGGETGLLKIYDGQARGAPEPGQGLVELVTMVILHDAYFYWLHRAMHHRKLYPYFHRLHHLSRAPTPWAAYAFAPLEAIVEAAFLPLVLVFVPAHVAVVFAFTTHMIVRNVVGHAGIELFPRRWLDWPVLRWITTTTHHDLHHAEYRANYGLYFTWWDKLMRTEHPQYRERFLNSVGPPESRAGRTRTEIALAILVVFGILAVTGPKALAGGQDIQSYEGRWATPGLAAVVDVSTDTSGPYPVIGAVVVWVWDDAHAAVIGTTLFEGLRFESGIWKGGTVFNPENGKTYRAALRLLDRERLQIKGCIGPFCQSQSWRRLESLLASLPDD